MYAVQNPLGPRGWCRICIQSMNDIYIYIYFFGLFKRQFFGFIMHYTFIYAYDRKKTEQNDFIEWKRSNVHDHDKYDDFRVVGESK